MFLDFGNIIKHKNCVEKCKCSDFFNACCPLRIVRLNQIESCFFQVDTASCLICAVFILLGYPCLKK